VILGAGGMLGTDLRKTFPEAIALSRRELDITDRVQVIRQIKELGPDVVINAAAYTDVDECEDEQELAYLVNGRAPGYIAEACASANARLVHYSTDYVFDGSRKEYAESDPVGPVNVYGKSKLAGERNIMRAMRNYRIIRTSWLFGAAGKNFVDTMISLSRQTDSVRVVNDQFGKPTYTADLARKTAEIIGLAPGVYHATNDGACSWYEFAGAVIGNVVPCRSEEFPRKAKRPRFSVLANTKTAPMRHWREALAEYLETKLVIA
jgi:dTDP-4-dehydrorhamnose reductase